MMWDAAAEDEDNDDDDDDDKKADDFDHTALKSRHGWNIPWTAFPDLKSHHGVHSNQI